MEDIESKLKSVTGFVQKEYGRVAAAAAISTEALDYIQQLKLEIFLLKDKLEKFDNQIHIDQLTESMFTAEDGKTVLAVSVPTAYIENEARKVLGDLSSALGAGFGDETTTIQQYVDRINWEIDFYFNATIDLCADVVEEASQNPQDVTWGVLKTRILALKTDSL